ncbi:MAG: hypothetical protein O3B13_14000, partial [Planctomycetota bacterium]|nr:hypothetical protein [Planctomycetota bacterium]
LCLGERCINGRLFALIILGLFPGIFDVEVDGGSVSTWGERAGLAGVDSGSRGEWCFDLGVLSGSESVASLVL